MRPTTTVASVLSALGTSCILHRLEFHGSLLLYASRTLGDLGIGKESLLTVGLRMPGGGELAAACHSVRLPACCALAQLYSLK